MSESTVGSTTEQVKDQVRDKAQVAQDKAGAMAGQARGRLSEQIDQRSTQAGDEISSAAHHVRSLAEQLRAEGKDMPARMVEQAADRSESFGSYLRNADGDRLLGDAESFARRQPWAVAAGGLALGFAASRLLKASSSRRYRSGQGARDLSYAGERTYPPTGGTSTMDPASAESDYGTEAPYVQTDPVPPVGGTYDRAPAVGTPVDAWASHHRGRRGDHRSPSCSPGAVHGGYHRGTPPARTAGGRNEGGGRRSAVRCVTWGRSCRTRPGSHGHYDRHHRRTRG